MPKSAPEGTRVILVMFELEDRIDSTAENLHEWLWKALNGVKSEHYMKVIREQLVEVRTYQDISD